MFNGKKGEITTAKAMELAGMKHTTFYRKVRGYEEQDVEMKEM